MADLIRTKFVPLLEEVLFRRLTKHRAMLQSTAQATIEETATTIPTADCMENELLELPPSSASLPSSSSSSCCVVGGGVVGDAVGRPAMENIPVASL